MSFNFDWAASQAAMRIIGNEQSACDIAAMLEIQYKAAASAYKDTKKPVFMGNLSLINGSGENTLFYVAEPKRILLVTPTEERQIGIKEESISRQMGKQTFTIH